MKEATPAPLSSGDGSSPFSVLSGFFEELPFPGEQLRIPQGTSLHVLWGGLVFLSGSSLGLLFLGGQPLIPRGISTDILRGRSSFSFGAPLWGFPHQRGAILDCPGELKRAFVPLAWRSCKGMTLVLISHDFDRRLICSSRPALGLFFLPFGRRG